MKVKTALVSLSSLSDKLIISIQQQEQRTFNGPFSGTTRASRYQKGKNNLDFTEARGSEWQWHQLGRMQVCTSLQTDNHASTPPLSFSTGRMPFLPPYQQRQSTEGSIDTIDTDIEVSVVGVLLQLWTCRVCGVYQSAAQFTQNILRFIIRLS